MRTDGHPVADPMNIVFAVDRGYLRQVAVTIRSIVENCSTPESIRFYIVHAEDEAFVAEAIAEWSVSGVTPVRVANDYGTVGGQTHVSKAAFIKSMLPEALSHLDRAIYLDADIILLGDARQLWEVDLKGAAMAGVVDLGVYIQMTRGITLGDFRRRDCQIMLGLDPEKLEYVNSGMMLMDLNQLRAMGFSERFRQTDETYRGRLIFVDQDIINSLLRGRMMLLDSRWNVHSTLMSRHLARRYHYLPDSLRGDLALQQSEQWAIHYTGGRKPWNSSEVWSGEKWWRYAELSGMDWPRPTAAKWSIAQAISEGWFDVASRLSAFRYNLRKVKSG